MGEAGNRIIKVGMALSILGTIVLAVGVLVNSVATSGGGSASFGGVILIGPIPIVFGTDRTTVLIGEIGVLIIMVVALVLFFMTTDRTTRHRSGTSI
jgi:uncharacterized membrane protein